MVRKEAWAHLLAYNLIRTVMAQAVEKHGVLPRTLSFTGAIQTLEAFHPQIARVGPRSRSQRERLYHELFHAVATHRVDNRPDRFKARRKKKRKTPYDPLMKSRAAIKLDIIKGVSKN